MALLATMLFIHAYAGIPGSAKQKIPDASICKPWVELKVVSPDLAQFGVFDDLGNYSKLNAFPTKGGRSIPLSQLEDIDRLPEWHSSTAGFAVYLVKGDWFLLHAKSGWYWLYCPINSLEEQDPANFNRNQIIDWQARPKDALDYNYDPNFHKPDGWFEYHQIMRIQPIRNERLRSTPSLDGKDLGPVIGEFLRFLDFNGDWVKVQEPIKIRWVPTATDHSDALQVRWNLNRVGWIRWRVPGPIPGTYHQLFRGRAHYGIID